MTAKMLLAFDPKKHGGEVMADDARGVETFARSTTAHRDLEDCYRAFIVMARIRSGEEEFYTLDDVQANLGLDD
jgi:hypothetical protein